MNERDSQPDPASDPPDAPAAAPPAVASPAAADAGTGAGSPWPLVLVALVVLSLLFGVWGAWTVLAGGLAEEAGPQRLARLEQEVTTLTRSDQISRDANRKLQATLAERDEEIAALRADVAFYERFVGATAQRRGLTVHELRLAPGGGDQVWHYTATLTQNLDRGSSSEGALRLQVEGTREGRLQQLDWSDLRQQEDAEPVAYSFRYFQQVEGDIVLPPGFTPTRVTVRLQPQGGQAVEQSFPWSDAAADATARSAPDA